MDFLPSLPVLLAFSAAGLLLALTPGPDMTLFLGRTLSQGRQAGLAVLLGTSLGCLVHTIAAAIGLSVLIAASPTGFWALKIVGALYLLWLAIQAIRNGSTFRLDRKTAASVSFWRNVMVGLGVNLLNPKVVIFFITFFPQFVSATDPDAWKKMLFLGVYFVALTVPMLVVMILMADRLAHVLTRNPMVARSIDWLFATVFATFAIKILLTEGR